MKKMMKLLGAMLLVFGLLMPAQAMAARWLVVGDTADSTDTLQAKLTALGTETFVAENGATAGARTLADLKANFDILYVGCQDPNPLANAAFQASVTGGAIEQWVRAGGVALFNVAHNTAADYTGPGGSVFQSAGSGTGAVGNAPTVTDLDHEYIVGTFSAAPVTLVDADFQLWGSSVHGQVSPPPGFVDAAGTNLGTSRVSGQFNQILASGVSGTSGATSAMLEYTLGNGYVLASMMTFDWTTRPAVAAVYDQLIDYAIAVLPTVAYIRGATAPWFSTTNEAAMDATFGVGKWTNTTMAVDGGSAFAPGSSYKFIWLEGSDATALELNTYLTAHLPAIEAWVAAGGKLFLNAAPNQGGNINFGFGGLTLTYGPSASDTVDIVNPAHSIATTPNALAVTQFTGGSFGHAVLTDGANPLTPLIVGAAADAQAGLTVLGELSSGLGMALFGGMTTDNFHLPQPDAHNLLINILTYLNGGVVYVAPAPAPAPAAAGGGGCSLDASAGFDPLFGMLVLLAFGALYRRRNDI